METLRPCKYGCGNKIAQSAEKCEQCGGKDPWPMTQGETIFVGAGLFLVVALLLWWLL